jgi:hypothetical protein
MYLKTGQYMIEMLSTACVALVSRAPGNRPMANAA